MTLIELLLTHPIAVCFIVGITAVSIALIVDTLRGGNAIKKLFED